MKFDNPNIMIIDNKQKLNKKYDIVTVWDFIEKYTS